jgi:hypothetical protein
MITFSDILTKNFIFTEVYISEEIYKHIWELDIPDTGIAKNEIRFKLTQSSDITKKLIISLISQISLEEYLFESIKNFNFEINKIRKGEYVPMHNEVSQKSPFEILIWTTRTDYFEGRDFVYQVNGNTYRIKPRNGMVCLLDTTSPYNYHGVTELITDTEVITIVGGEGAK